MSAERRNENVPTDVLIRMRTTSQESIKNWQRSIDDAQITIDSGKRIIEKERQWIAEVQEELDLRVKELADQAKRES